jgi:hypothetical protein
VKTKSSSEGDGGDYSRIGITPIRWWWTST